MLDSIENGNDQGFAYTYDQRGNIQTLSEKADGTSYVLRASYAYDEWNQMIRADDAKLNTTVTYQYDAGGNLLEKKVYPYTTGSLEGVSADSVIPYTYGDVQWKDKLTAYNGQTITYDAIGNPLAYRDGMSFTWQYGRQLSEVSKPGVMASYIYNEEGLRTAKTVNGIKTDYYLNGSSIMAQISGNDRMDFYYDESGNAFGFLYNGQEYFYTRNGQNDIVGILDSAGTQVVSYVYDSWGQVISVDGALASSVGQSNPFRYRGYYFDESSGFYYCGSRYYDPEVGRFINADGQLNPQEGFTGLNMFQYCGNNPVNRADPTGHAFMFLTAAIGAAVGAVVGGVVGYVKTGTVKGALIGAGVGAVAGGLIGLGAGALAGAVLAGSATASTAAVVAGAGAVLSQAGNAISAGVNKVSNAVSKIGNKSTTVYRSVSQSEATSIKELNKFTLPPGGMEAKQFGFSVSETMQFGQKYGQSIIVKARVPNNMLSQLYTGGKGGIDNPIFRSGTVTVYGDMLDAFNTAVAGSIQIMP